MAKRRTLTEALSETEALRGVRNAAAKRTSRAKREAIAASPPDTALRLYLGTMDTYAARAQALVEKHVLSRLPVLGSGDLLDVAYLNQGITRFRYEMDALAIRARRSATAAAKRVSSHARGEVSRMMRLSVPKDDVRARLAVSDFANSTMIRLQAAASAQVAQIRKAIVEHQEGESLRQKILDSLWVTRNRSRMIARDEVFKLQAETIETWALAIGSRRFVWCTRRDERVRPGHAVLDGKEFDWNNPPNTGNAEGNNRPGQAINCRCRAVPVEALE